MSQFAEQFLARDLSLDGQPISLDIKTAALKKIREAVSSPQKKGEHALILEKDPLIFSLLYFHLIDLGYCPIALSPNTSDHLQANFIASMEDPGFWINGSWKKATKLNALAPERAAYACFTSGTTSAPKLCYLSLSGAKANALGHADSLGIHPGSQLLQCLPLHHSFGLVCYLWVTLFRGCRLDFNTVLLTLRNLDKRELKSAVIHISPSQLAFLNKEKAAIPPGLEVVSVGSGLADLDALKSFHSKLPTSSKLYVSYGLTEAGPRVTSGLVTAQTLGKKGYIGKAIPNVTLGVLTGAGKVEPSGDGKLCVQSASLKINLESHEKSTAGSLVTRDQVILDREGHVYFLGRSDDLLKVGGVSIYPLDIEVEVRKHPAVKDCVILKGKSSIYEDVPLLFVETDETNSEVFLDFLKDKLDVAQIPRQIHLRTKFPRHSLEKIDRRKLLEEVGVLS